MIKNTPVWLYAPVIMIGVLSVSKAEAREEVYNGGFTYETLNYPGTDGGGTFFTGFRGDTITGDYTIANTPNTGGLLYSRATGTWLNFPENLPPVNLSGATANTSYSVTWGSYGNTLRGVGTYKTTATGSTDLSYLYDATAPADSQITDLQVPVNLKGDGNMSPTIFTFVHSISGNFLVGDYDTELATGNAFIYNISAVHGDVPVAARTYQPINIPDSISTTAYGIYGQYISGGFAKPGDVESPGSIGLNHGYIGKLTANGTLENYMELNHPNSLFTHIEGITGGGRAGRFNLVADYIDATGVHASYAHVTWDGVNDISHINNKVEWFDYNVPEGSTTSANSGYQDMVVGIYTNTQTNAYLGTIANVTTDGVTHLIYEPFAYNTGAIVTTANEEAGVGIDATTIDPIYGNQYNDVINASTGSITTSGREAHGIVGSEYGVITNNGTITVSGQDANAVHLHGKFGTLLNYGQITGNYSGQSGQKENYTILVSGRSILAQINESDEELEEEHDPLKTFATVGTSITNLNTGTISYLGNGGAAVANGGEETLIDNAGVITSVGDNADAIRSRGDHTTIGNSGLISASGANSAGIQTLDGSTTLNNTGIVQASGANSSGVYLASNRGHTNRVVNAGSITGEAYGVRTNFTVAEVINTGLIQASTNAVSLDSSDSSLTNTGTIIATANGGNAILSTGSNNTVTLNPGSVIRGVINSQGTNNTLHIDSGLNSAQSYAYTTSGDWNLVDANAGTRAAAASGGIAAAAGISVAETGGQMLYQHNDAINQSILRHSGDVPAGNNGRVVWADPYFSTITRSAESNPVLNKFRSDTYGVTAGFQLPVTATRLDSIVNVQSSTLDIQDNSQSVSSDSIMVGLAAPKLRQILGADLSGKVLVGYTDHDGDRQVFTNSGTGTENVTAHYGSYSGILGTALTRRHKIDNTYSTTIAAGVDLTAEHYESYAESAYFSWDSNTLTQFSSHLDAGVEGSFMEQKLSLYAGAGIANRWLVDGQKVTYQIGGTAESFNGSKDSDTYFSGQLGAKYKVATNTHIFTSINAAKSLNDVDSFQAIIGGSVKF